MEDSRAEDGQDLNHLLRQGAAGGEAKSVVTPLGAAGVGIAGFVAGAAVMAVWGPWSASEPEAEATVSVASCAEQYVVIADSLDAMVSEGVAAGQATSLEVSWIDSIHRRQEAIASQLESLSLECIDGNGAS